MIVDDLDVTANAARIEKCEASLLDPASSELTGIDGMKRQGDNRSKLPVCMPA